jgi:3-dehydrosphinganine reductase
MRDLDGKRVLITGGSSGIGLATAMECARGGAHVAVVARGVARLEDARQRIQACSRPGRNVEAWSLDVTDADATERLAPQALATLGGLDLLVCNAGASHAAAASQTSLATYHEMMNVNFFGTVHVTRAFLPHFMRQGSGHVSAVSSIAGFLGVYGYTAYSASKHAITGYMETLRQELVPHGVGASIIFPGDTDTPQFHAENEQKPEGTWAVAGVVPVMSPEQVARVFVSGILEGKFHIVPGLVGKATYAMHHHLPGAVRFVVDRLVLKLGPEAAPRVRKPATAKSPRTHSS